MNFTDRLVHDPDGARALLDEAGWVPGPDGIRQRNGTPLAVDLPYAREDQVVLLVQQQLRAVGIDVRLRKVAQAERNKITAAGEYSYYFHARSGTQAAAALAQAFSSRYANYIGGGSAGLNADRLVEVDALADALVNAPNEETAVTVSGELQTLLLDEGYVVPLWPYSEGYATLQQVKGAYLVHTGSILSLRDAWLEN